MTLYDMIEQGRALYDMLSSEEIDEQTFSDTLESIGVQDKLEAYAKVIKQLKADAEMLKAEKMKLAEKQARAEKAVDRLYSAIIEFMHATGAEKTSAGVFTFRISRSSSVVVDDLSKIPKQFISYAEPKVDKTAVKKAIASGEAVEGCRLEEKEGVQIK